MGKIGKHTTSEIRLLPFTLGKLAGGAMAVIGFPGALFALNKKPGVTLLDTLPFLVLGIAGVLLFVLFSRLLAKRMAESKTPAPSAREKAINSLIAWIGFALFILVFIAVTFFLAR